MLFRSESYISLAEADKEIVRKMASILRIADALDRSHLETVHDFKATVKDKELEIKVNAPEKDLYFEKEGLANKADLFQTVFNKKVSVEGML